MPDESWPRLAVVGAGAVGCYFGGLLARAGAPVVLVGREATVAAIARDGLFLESEGFEARLALAATTDPAAVRQAEIVLLCVKTPDTETAARSIAPHLAPGASVVSLQNGVDNVERIRAATGIEAVAAVVYVAVEMTAAGRVRHSGRGDLVVGSENLARLFSRAHVPCRVSENLPGELWTKLIVNCAYNAISALSRARYGRIVAHPLARELMREVVEEALAVATAAGIVLPPGDLVEACWDLAQAMPDATSSTAQDVARGRRTEIDALNGYVARRGAALGVPTPVNHALHALVALLEGPSPPL